MGASVLREMRRVKTNFAGRLGADMTHAGA
jgi:hypothetical protein